MPSPVTLVSSGEIWKRARNSAEHFGRDEIKKATKETKGKYTSPGMQVTNRHSSFRHGSGGKNRYYKPEKENHDTLETGSKKHTQEQEIKDMFAFHRINRKKATGQFKNSFSMKKMKKWDFETLKIISEAMLCAFLPLSHALFVS